MAEPIHVETLEVKHNGETYEFSIPSFADEIKIGMIARSIRRELDPEGTGSPEGLDYGTFLMVQTAAQFQTLLRTASVKWPWVPGEQGEPLIDYKRWPSGKVDEASAVGLAFQAELARFRGGGVRKGQPSGTKTVDSGEPARPQESVASGSAESE